MAHRNTQSPFGPSSEDGGEEKSGTGPASKEKERWPEILPQSWNGIPDALSRWCDRSTDFKEEEKKKAWDETARIVQDYGEELVERWKKNIDDLPVYAGLFSAALTALIVESYRLLLPPPPDPVLAALQQISVQLTSFSVTPPFVNSTQPDVSQILPPAPPTWAAPRWAVWLNALWFSSLIFSFSAASVGIMVKQWLNEHSTGLYGDSRHFARLREHRLQNLEKWHVEAIVIILPILLQLALALFFGGLLVWLWNINADVAAVASILIGLLFVFTMGSSLIPIFRADCCFLTPPVHVLFNTVRTARPFILHLYRLMSKVLHPITGTSLAVSSNWLSMSWRGRELKQISQASDDLDVALVTRAYTTSMDHSYLSDYATICFSDFLKPLQVVDCYRRLAHEMDLHQQDKANIPLTITSDLWVTVKYVTQYNGWDSDRLPDMDRFWADSYSRGKIPTSASSRNHLWANALIGGNTSVANDQAIQCFDNEEYDHCSNTVRRNAVRVIEQELREYGQEADDNALRRCSQHLQILLSWVAAGFSKKDAQPEDIKTAQVIRALTRHGLLCHLKCYTTEAGKTLSLLGNDTLSLMWRLRKLCKDEDPNFMTRKLAHALVRVYRVHEEVLRQPHPFWDPEEDKSWILNLRRARKRPNSHAHIKDEPRPVDSAPAAAIAEESAREDSSYLQDIHAPPERAHRAAEREPESLVDPPPPSSSSTEYATADIRELAFYSFHDLYNYDDALLHSDSRHISVPVTPRFIHGSAD